MPLEDDFVAGIRKGDVDFLRKFLDQHPKMLSETFDWDCYGGYALNCAASFNQPAVIEFLVKEWKADVNRQDGVSHLWPPLRHAAICNAYAAASMLLSLGANPSLKDESGSDTVAFCQSDEVQIYRDPDIRAKKEQEKRLKEEQARQEKEKIRAQKISGTWKLNAPKEVEHDYKLPERGYHLTDIFNFESRQFRAIVENSGKTALSHTIHFFDEMPDTDVLYQALQKLKELGGDADETAIHSRRLIGKRPF